MRIEVEIIIDSETREYYGFNLFECMNCIFVTYHQESKPKGKRTWKRTKFWDKYSRQSTIQEPELTQNVRELALEKAKSLIKVKTWKEWRP